jgi:hypothetical protein
MYKQVPVQLSGEITTTTTVGSFVGIRVTSQGRLVIDRKADSVQEFSYR